MNIGWLASRLSMVWAPFHEAGHILFGWISLNPTIPTGWNEVRSINDTFFMSIGGGFGEFAGIAIVSVMLLPYPRFWWISLVMWGASLLSIPAIVAGDFGPGWTVIATELCYMFAASGLAFMLYRRIVCLVTTIYPVIPETTCIAQEAAPSGPPSTSSPGCSRAASQRRWQRPRGTRYPHS
jgi:hypothetical protein